MLKYMYYNDEDIHIKISVDNSHSVRDIKRVRCVLIQEVTTRKGPGEDPS